MLRLRRIAGLLAGFLLTTLAARWYAEPRGLTLAEPQVNRVRAELVTAYAGRDGVEDVLLLGSSRVRAGLDARQVQSVLRAGGLDGIEVYKLGLAGMRAPLLAELVEDVLVHRPPRRLLVVGIEERFFARADGEAGEWDSDQGELGPWRAFGGLRGLWQLPWLASARTQRMHELHRRLLGQRMSDRLRRASEKGVQARRAGDRSDNTDRARWVWPEPGDPTLAAFDACLDRLGELPCAVVFVRMPTAVETEQGALSAVGQRFGETIPPELERRGFRYLDLNRPPYPRHAEAFVDQTHLTQAHGVRVSRMLARELAGMLTGRSADAPR